MLCVQTVCKRTRRVPSTLVIQRNLSRKEKAANEHLRDELRKLEAYDPNKHELMGFQSLNSEYLYWRLRRGPPKLQKRFLLRQIREVNPSRHCSYKGQSIEDLKQELASLQNTSQPPQLQAVTE